jgi:hypothetical protein
VRREDTAAPPDDHKDLPEYLDHPPAGWEHEEHHEEHDDEPPPDEIVAWTTTTEKPAPTPPRRNFSKLLGKKLTTIPLIFTLWFIAYCMILIIRSTFRRQDKLVNKFKARTLNDVFTTSEKLEALNEVTQLVLTMIDNFKKTRR